MKSKDIILGLLAHVDSGKTTLAESILYETGAIRKQGRVDHKDSFLDTDEMERKRGITIFSKQARIKIKEKNITLVDTPGHIDFSTEMERTLQILDYAILVISAAEGVQSHTKTLWNLLEYYKIPTFIFVNKMDQTTKEKEKIQSNLCDKLSPYCVEFNTDYTSQQWKEEIALTDELIMEEYLEKDIIDLDKVKKVFSSRKVFPVIFGSALKNNGIETLLDNIYNLCEEKNYSDSFSARVYKIERDQNNNRLTHMKITGGSIRVKSVLRGGIDEIWNEKVDQIRVYSGNQFESYEEMTAGSVCTVVGLSKTYCGEGLGDSDSNIVPILEPVMTYKVSFTNADSFLMYNKIKVLEEEDPSLHIIWNEKYKEIHMQIMGEIQIDIIKNIISERFNEEAEFGSGSIIYKETISKSCIGIGHFEPLKHYAETHIRIEPLERGSGIEYATEVSEDVLGKNWQRLILQNLREKNHKGVLTGSDMTDVRYTVINGRAHLKHTEGGDFRQATYRAVRQGLMTAESILLEPYYSFRAEVPQDFIGRVMTDINQMDGTIGDPMIENGIAYLQGTCPVSTLKDYSNEIVSFSHGEGKLYLQVCGYDICHNQEEVIKNKNYNPESDLANTPDSIFCAHGAGFVVPWYDVPDMAHIVDDIEESKDSIIDVKSKKSNFDDFISQEEIDSIMQKTYGNTKQKRVRWAKTVKGQDYISESKYKGQNNKKGKDYLLVDGYNIIFAWNELNELSKVNIDAARDKLMDILCNYQGYIDCNIILVFDAYKVHGGKGSIFDYNNIHVVYTMEAQTADAYIEKITHELTKENNVIVATSDRLEQMIIWGAGAQRLSAQGLLDDIERANKKIVIDIDQNNQNNKTDNKLNLEDLKQFLKGSEE